MQAKHSSDNYSFQFSALSLTGLEATGLAPIAYIPRDLRHLFHVSIHELLKLEVLILGICHFANKSALLVS